MCTVKLNYHSLDHSKDEQSQKQKEAPVRSALCQAQRQYEALAKLI